jgi:MFS family permease
MSSIDTPTSPPSSYNDEKPLDATNERKKNIWAGKSGRFWAAFATLNLTAFISALDAVIIAAALPAITSELGGSSNQAFWSGTAFLLAATITQPLFGTFSEIFGRRLNLVASLLWFLLGSILCARSTYMGMFIGSRVVCCLLLDFLILDSRNWRWRNDCIG